jgi:hypothetical protein
MPPQITAEELNSLHRAFWARMTVLRDEIMGERELALEIDKVQKVELASGIPPGKTSSLEAKCELVGKLRRVLRRSDGLKGGRPAGGDRLQRFIEERISQNPHLSFEGLKAAMRDPSHRDLIADVEENYVSYDDDRDHSRQIKNGALRARFFRARREAQP